MVDCLWMVCKDQLGPTERKVIVLHNRMSSVTLTGTTQREEFHHSGVTYDGITVGMVLAQTAFNPAFPTAKSRPTAGASVTLSCCKCLSKTPYHQLLLSTSTLTRPCFPEQPPSPVDNQVH